MTDREKAIVMAYTGYTMLTGDKLGIFYDYVTEKLGRSIMTHELAYDEVADEIKRAATDDFYALCMRDDTAMEAPTVGGWISVNDRLPDDGKFVLVCNDEWKMMIAKYESEVIHWEYKYTNYDWDVWDDDEQGPVCYWMPLPEPPKEVSEDD